MLLTVGTGAYIASGLVFSGATAVAVSRFKSTYIATTDQQGGWCLIHTCTLVSPGSASCSSPTTVGACSALRVASDGSNIIMSLVSFGTLYFQIGTIATPSGPIDDLEAMVPLVVGATPYRIVWRSTNVILTDTFPTKGVAADTLDSSGFGPSPGAGFDAVADDPSQTGYAVVYYRAGATKAAIEFLHRCK
jgi:hypothetical protein